MKINLNDVLFAISYALDCVEHELLGSTTNHGKRVAYISTILGKSLGFSNENLFDLAALAVLHDNALTEYLKIEYNKELFEKSNKKEIGIHCQIGEKNIQGLYFHSDIKGVILYHHENFDGTGPFNKKASETPLMAQLIHFADILDVNCNLNVYEKDKEIKIKKFLQKNQNTLFSAEHIALFLDKFSAINFASMQGDGIDELLKMEIPQIYEDYEKEKLFNIAGMFAKIIDYKSEATSKHSLGIAQKAFQMANYYNYDEETSEKLYFAGALHDIGKLIVPKDILEKPDKLTSKEYFYIQTHVWYTYEILRKIKGFEDITNWASMHHEKLNGKGYPFGKTAKELSKNERLMACLDVYQALREKRSYKAPLSHIETMKILNEMVDDGSLDKNIVNDIDEVFKYK